LPRTLAGVVRELELLGGHGALPLRTLYFGGGTPSLTPEAQLEAIFATVARCFPLRPGGEVTLEANPDDVTPERVAMWARLGVNRVSVGVQAFCDRVLAMLSRRHDAAQATAAVELLERAGFDVSLDLMLGLPGMTRADLDASLAETVRLRPGHVSVYLLEMDKPHALARLAGRRPDLFPTSDLAASQYLAAGRALLAAGYRHYEVSNFALPGRAARHNLRYWRRKPVLAAGLAAHGQSGQRRWANLDDLSAYLAAVESGHAPRAWSRRQTPAEVTKERVMLGLRLARGVEMQLARSAGALAPAFHERLDDFLTLGLARCAGARVRLTPRGWLVSNELFAALW
jgi:oxygen-independent coproporphyrinogen-3 oxidase